MTQELTALPEEFSAGTTVRYRKRFTDYPASAGWTLTLYLGGPSARAKTAAADEDDFVVTLAASDTGGDFVPGSYQAVERVSNEAGDVYQVDARRTNITPNLAEATDGSSQDWLERAIPVLRAHIEGRLPAGLESYQVAGRVVSKMPIKDADDLLCRYESRLARLRNPDATIRPILMSFTEPGFSQ
jgi:hypothetical protein